VVRALVAAFCLDYSVVMDVELPALAVTHLLVIHPVEPKWLHLVDLVAEQLQAVVQKSLLAVRLPFAVLPVAVLPAAEWRAHAVLLADQSFRLSEPSLAA